ncbi:helix-turn-helix domain-containing protein [Paenibacillus radicis (ex Gao et al. 2016)]|uniref:Transcriptional regulator n=1 Tax=Paenibacillus radicis (ex Gao et al. 2016) TaxID=1737354 RepID=A0A917GY76_9BACL|nr:XRE family transcriptional regulator [Paenibacillus radicis (ex Gao et al. 2016)]GGG61008.1 transcriptional regulator [Paenibacillus radicis (ex Gao et al. 2016)]
MHPINISISKNVLRIRKDRKLSLDQVAELSGVSKAMLGQIERGETNPTITTLWKIANGLRISFSSLIKEESALVTIMSKESVVALTEDEGKYRVYPLFPFDPKKQFEMYAMEIDPQCCHESEPHHEGVEEYISVTEGTLELLIEQELFIVNPGSTIHFQAEKPHAYRNSGESTVKCMLTVHYPG